MEFSTLKRVFRGAQRIEPHEDLDSVFTSGSQLGQSHRHDDLIHELQRESFQLKRQLSSVFAQFHLVKEELVVKTQATRQLHRELAASQQCEMELTHQLEVMTNEMTKYEHLADELMDEKQRTANIQQRLEQTQVELSATMAGHDTDSLDQKAVLKINLLTERNGQLLEQISSLRADLTEMRKETTKVEAELESATTENNLLMMKLKGMTELSDLAVQDKVEAVMASVDEKVTKRVTDQVRLQSSTQVSVLEEALASVRYELESSQQQAQAYIDSGGQAEAAAAVAAQENRRLEETLQTALERCENLAQELDITRSQMAEDCTLKIHRECQTSVSTAKIRLSTERGANVVFPPLTRFLSKENLPPLCLAEADSDSNDFLTDEPVRKRSRSPLNGACVTPSL
ncbi:MAG: hypothetical protein KVP17_000012 [Porospora cf. gigantea B]|uniref:uncharacterized protein n=1 Tax=Porospora cf. gigantea B TaxID=2853592 RepID=UPI003571824E|nr:MAG: hypothetical protein KVP17_000012 [Porospora cf. gigantea B]